MKTMAEWAHEIWSESHVVNGISRGTAKRIVVEILEGARAVDAEEWADRAMDELGPLPAGARRGPVLSSWFAMAMAAARGARCTCETCKLHDGAAKRREGNS